MSPPGGGIEIGIVRADGTQLRQLTFSGKFVSFAPAFSPDGTKIIFSRALPDGWVGLFTMNPDGSDVTQITRNGSADYWPQWASK
jgi:Tol biopolymer transport system component